MTVSSFEAARHLCRVSGWTLTNLALQKILYLAHMSFVGQHQGNPLVEEDFEAWAYGPVLPNLYRRAKMFGNAAVQDVFYDVEDVSDTPEGAMITSAWENLKSKTASQLVAITHWPQGAWAASYKPGEYGCEIPNGLILQEYERRKQLAADRRAAT